MEAKPTTSCLGRMEPSASRPGSVGGDDDGAGDPVVGGDGQGKLGVIIDPAQDRRPQPAGSGQWVKSPRQHSFGRSAANHG